MSDVITTASIEGYSLSIVLSYVRGKYHVYDVLLHTHVTDETLCITQYIFKHALDRAELERKASADVRELQEILTALVKTLPDAESVKDGVHEL